MCAKTQEPVIQSFTEEGKILFILGPALPYLGILGIEFKKSIVIFEISKNKEK